MTAYIEWKATYLTADYFWEILLTYFPVKIKIGKNVLPQIFKGMHLCFL